MAKKKKYYVVWKGLNPGVYMNWNDCKSQIDGYPNARYKGFTSLDTAKQAFKAGPGFKEAAKSASNHYPSDVLQHALSVDAACQGNPGRMEYQGVWVGNKERLFHQGPFEQGTNNVGEFLALVHALAFLKEKGREDIPIYTDSLTARAWVRKKKANTKLKFGKRNQKLLELIQRAEAWLRSNTFKNSILKWDTVNWGEIPADFGRK